MLNSLFVIDNALDNPEEIVDFAKQQQFYELDTHPTEKNSYWSGLRTECVSNSDMYLFSSTVNNLLDKVFTESFGKRIKYSFEWSGSASYHILDESQVFNKNWFHVDASAYAGVVYLNKNVRKGRGTKIKLSSGEIVNIENKYNRFVIYNSKLFHTISKSFGWNKDNGRLVMSQFFSFNLKK